MKAQGIAVVLAASVAAVATAQPKAPPATRTTLVKAARIVDVQAGRYLAGQAVLVENYRIKEVGPAAAVQAHAPADAVVIDLGGATLLPGLIDCHAHLLSAMRARRTAGENILVTVAEMSASQRALLGAANAREALEAGITTVRNVGHSGVDGDAALRDAVNEGWVAGPRMQAATRKLTPPGGNSGIQFRSVPHGGSEAKGCQADIGAGWWGRLYEESARGLLFPKKGAAFDGDKFIKKEDWNTYEILAVGAKIRTAVNGKLCTDLDDDKVALKGRFALQVHSGGQMEVRFRNFQLEVNPKFELKTVK